MNGLNYVTLLIKGGLIAAVCTLLFSPFVGADTLVWNESRWNQHSWSFPVLVSWQPGGSGAGFIVINNQLCESSCEFEMDSGTMLHVAMEAEAGSYLVQVMNDSCQGEAQCSFRIEKNELLRSDFVLLSTSSPHPVELPLYQPNRARAYVVSEPIELQGLNGPVVLEVQNGEVSLNCTPEFTTDPVLYYPGMTFCLRHRASSSNQDVIYSTLMVGEQSIVFRSQLVQRLKRQRLLIKIAPLVQARNDG